MSSFLDVLNGVATAYGTATNASATRDAAAKQAAANEAARQKAAASATGGNTTLYAIIGGAVAIVLVAILLFKK
jgi:CHASE3 domain sensor protein